MPQFTSMNRIAIDRTPTLIQIQSRHRLIIKKGRKCIKKIMNSYLRRFLALIVEKSSWLPFHMIISANGICKEKQLKKIESKSIERSGFDILFRQAKSFKHGYFRHV